MPKVVVPDVPVLTPQHLKALLSVCKGDTFPALRDRALILLLMESGLRRTECISLHVNDLDLRSQTAVVRRGKGGRGRKRALAGALFEVTLHPPGRGRWLKSTPRC